MPRFAQAAIKASPRFQTLLLQLKSAGHTVYLPLHYASLRSLSSPPQDGKKTFDKTLLLKPLVNKHLPHDLQLFTDGTRGSW